MPIVRNKQLLTVDKLVNCSSIYLRNFDLGRGGTRKRTLAFPSTYQANNYPSRQLLIKEESNFN